MLATVEVFADVRCPFTHVGLRRLVARRAELCRDRPRLLIRAWPLELVNGEPIDAALVQREVEGLQRRVAPDLFVGLSTASFGSTSLPALALANAAYRASPAVGEAVSLALRDAVFESGLDVGQADVLAAIGARHGVGSVTEADHAAVRRDLSEGRQRGVIGSPHFFLGDNSYFCPTLEIRHDGDNFDVQIDEDALADFFASVFDD